MEGKCSNPDCAAPISCHDGIEDHAKCPNWIKNNLGKQEKLVKANIRKNNGCHIWTGEPFKIEDIHQISYRNTPILIGLVGKAKAGKTTFLAMLYTLLLKGLKFNEYNFAGTKTIIGWDKLYHKLKYLKSDVSFPDPTPSNYLRLLHFALRNEDSQLKDILLTDASGEVFSDWSQNKDDINAENARWINSTSNGFILFIDCDDLIKRKNAAKTEIIDIAEMLKNGLNDRPVVAVWSKSDLKGVVHTRIKESLKEELQEIFGNYSEIDISNLPADDPDQLVHENNLKVIDRLLDMIIVPIENELIISNNYENDLFLNFKGK